MSATVPCVSPITFAHHVLLLSAYSTIYAFNAPLLIALAARRLILAILASHLILCPTIAVYNVVLPTVLYVHQQMYAHHALPCITYPIMYVSFAI